MGVCLEKKCSINQEKVNGALNVEIKEKNKLFNQEEENQNNIEESELTKKDKQNVNQNNINNSKATNGYITYKIQSKFKSKIIRCSNNGQLSNNSINIYNENHIKTKDKFDKLIYFTNLINKNDNNSVIIKNAKTK